jgi:hypothetical protein
MDPEHGPENGPGNGPGKEGAGGEPEEASARPKDRIVQTRVPRDLETTLKREARRRRLTVSHLVRNVLEDAFQLVDDVVANVDDLVNDSVELVRRVRSDARRVAGAVRDGADEEPAREATTTAPEPTPESDALAHVWAWNRVVLNRPATCSRCGRRLARGSEAHAGLADDPSRPRAWLCGECIEALAHEGEVR